MKINIRNSYARAITLLLASSFINPAFAVCDDLSLLFDDAKKGFTSVRGNITEKDEEDGQVFETYRNPIYTLPKASSCWVDAEYLGDVDSFSYWCSWNIFSNDEQMISAFEALIKSIDSCYPEHTNTKQRERGKKWFSLTDIDSGASVNWSKRRSRSVTFRIGHDRFK